jgi:hypothetical protein
MKNYVSCYFRAYAAKKDPAFERLILNLPWGSERARKAYEYARCVLKSRWVKGEKDIAFAYQYSKYVLKSRWKRAEKVISKDAYSAHLYAKYVLKGRFPLAEKNAKWHTDFTRFYHYCKYVLKKPWPEMEKKIENLIKNESRFHIDAESIASYCVHVSKRRWEEMEKYVIESRHIAKYVKALKTEADKEEFHNKVLITAMTENPNRYYYNYAKEYIKSLKPAEPRQAVL